MSGPDIPDEAVEAAARTHYEAALLPGSWDVLPEDGKEVWRRTARRALAAARPLLVEAAVAEAKGIAAVNERANALQDIEDVEAERDEARAQVASVLALVEEADEIGRPKGVGWVQTTTLRAAVSPEAAAAYVRDMKAETWDECKAAWKDYNEAASEQAYMNAAHGDDAPLPDPPENPYREGEKP